MLVKSRMLQERYKQNPLAVLRCVLCLGVGLPLTLWANFSLAESWTFPLKVEETHAAARRLKCFSSVRGTCTEEMDTTERLTYPPIRSASALYGVFPKGNTPVDPGTEIHLLFDESQGTGTGYDRLYFDQNENGDLTDDGHFGIPDEPPEGFYPQKDCRFSDYFESVTVSFGESALTLRFIPHLYISRRGHISLSFTPEHSRVGQIEFAGQRFQAFLTQVIYATPGFDSPYAALFLIRDDGSQQCRQWDMNRLGLIRKFDGQLYRFSATQDGSQLTVSENRSPLGKFAMGQPREKLRLAVIEGLLTSATSSVIVGDRRPKTRSLIPKAVSRLPVGNYSIDHLRLLFNSLTFSLRAYRKETIQTESEASSSPIYPIEIRQRKPFLYNFRTPPKTVFVGIEKDAQLRRGDMISIRALLVFEDLNVAFSGIREIRPNGKSGVPLMPTVVVADSSGRIVTKGTMRYG